MSRRADLTRDALRAGLATFVATSFVLALFLAPVLAGHADFGHIHPENTPAHVHPISSFLSSAPASSALTLLFSLLVTLILADFTLVWPEAPAYYPLGSRAPPAPR